METPTSTDAPTSAADVAASASLPLPIIPDPEPVRQPGRAPAYAHESGLDLATSGTALTLAINSLGSAKARGLWMEDSALLVHVIAINLKGLHEAIAKLAAKAAHTEGGQPL